MKYSWSLTSVVVFRPDPPRADQGRGQNMSRGDALMHVYVWEHIVTHRTQSAFTTKPLNGFLQNLVGMKCSCIMMFWPYLPRDGSRVRPNRSRGSPLTPETSSDRKATARNPIHSNDLVACVMKCSCFGSILQSNF